MPIEALRASLPWFVMEAITYLQDECLEPWGTPEPKAQAFEWGSGGSTLWLSQRCATVVTLEHNREWYESTLSELSRYGIPNVDLVYRELGQGYSDYILRYPNEFFDVISVDGRERAACVTNALHKLKVDGIFILDNSERGQYQEAMKLLSRWERHDFDSGYTEGWTTTVWRRR